jgi:hypothetical protein
MARGRACLQAIVLWHHRASATLTAASLLLLLSQSNSALALSLGEESRLSQPLILGQEYHYLEDTSGELDIETVSAPEHAGLFRPHRQRDDPNFGYSNSAYWLRIDIENHSTGIRQWYLELPFPTLDEVDVFLLEKHSGQLLQHYRGGDRRPFAERPIAHRNLVFPLELPASTPTRLYLRVASKGSSPFPPTCGSRRRSMHTAVTAVWY